MASGIEDGLQSFVPIYESKDQENQRAIQAILLYSKVLYYSIIQKSLTVSSLYEIGAQKSLSALDRGVLASPYDFKIHFLYLRGGDEDHWV